MSSWRRASTLILGVGLMLLTAGILAVVLDHGSWNLWAAGLETSVVGLALLGAGYFARIVGTPPS